MISREKVVEKLLEIIFNEWDKIVKSLKRWCLSRWYLGWSNRWYLALFMLPCRIVHISDVEVAKEYERAMSLMYMCELSFNDLCGFFIALMVAVAKAQGFDISDFKARYGKYCKEVYVTKMPGLYVMCRALGVGKLRNMEKTLRRIRERQAGHVGYYVELVKLALGVRDVYNVKAAYCVPFVHVTDHSGGSGGADKRPREPIAQVVEACRRLKDAVEKAVG